MKVRFVFPNELIESLDPPADCGHKNFVLDLYLDEEISFGKAAKLLDMTYDEFIDFLGRKRVPYFHNTPEEISEALEKLKPV